MVGADERLALSGHHEVVKRIGAALTTPLSRFERLNIRYMFGITGTALTNGAIGPSAARSTPADAPCRGGAMFPTSSTQLGAVGVSMAPARKRVSFPE